MALVDWMKGLPDFRVMPHPVGVSKDVNDMAEVLEAVEMKRRRGGRDETLSAAGYREPVFISGN